jgi:hypothetical protein
MRRCRRGWTHTLEIHLADFPSGKSIGATGTAALGARDLPPAQHRSSKGVRVHRIPPRVHDDREPPFMWDRTAENKPVTWVCCEEEIFLRRGLAKGINSDTGTFKYAGNHRLDVKSFFAFRLDRRPSPKVSAIFAAKCLGFLASHSQTVSTDQPVSRNNFWFRRSRFTLCRNFSVQ